MRMQKYLIISTLEVNSPKAHFIYYDNYRGKWCEDTMPMADAITIKGKKITKRHGHACIQFE